MAKGYQHRICVTFPEMEIGTEFSTLTQTTTLPEIDQSPRSIIRFLGESEHPNYLKYTVMHETIRNITVRFENQVRPSVIQRVEFNLFRSKSDQRIFLDTKRKYANELLKRLEMVVRQFDYEEKFIDLSTMHKAIAIDVVGGHFNNLSLANVSSASVRGPTITDSEEWERFDQSGDMSMIDLLYVYNSVQYRISITQNAGVVIYPTVSEKVEMGIVDSVSLLISPFILSET